MGENRAIIDTAENLDGSFTSRCRVATNIGSSSVAYCIQSTGDTPEASIERLYITSMELYAQSKELMETLREKV